jgi:very-short-patch-repair endonuclease
VTLDLEQAESRLERAKNLFEFLGRAQQLKTAPPRSTDSYHTVVWFADLPDHPAVSSAHRGGDPDTEAPLFTVDRVPREAPPELEPELVPWLAGALDDPATAPTLVDAVPAVRVPSVQPQVTVDNTETDEVRLEHMPEIRNQCESWLGRWQVWAEKELEDRPGRDLYGSLFSTYVTAGGHPEELELVLGVGCLSWAPDGHPRVHRHLLTCSAAIAFDDDSGRLTVTREAGLDPMTVELDMLDPGMIRNSKHINDLKTEVQAFDGHPLHRDDIGVLARRIVHTLDAEGRYRDDDAVVRPGPAAVASYAPALILRKRSQQGLVEIFQTIVAQLSEADDVPAGIVPLIDPDYRPTTEPDPTPGAVIEVDDELFLPLPVNDRQRKILQAVDTRAQTVVQGPPGTGKTHTAAALLSHLLAQGKRVLVAAHTDRALQEVRDKLPETIKPLSVAVVGSSRSDMADLKVAVERIAATAAEHDAAEAQQQSEAALAKIDDLRRQRAATYRQLLQAREHEVSTHQDGAYQGTLAGIAQQYQHDADTFGWIAPHVDVTAGSGAPLDDGEILEWHRLLQDVDLMADESDSRDRLIELDTIPQPQEFATLCETERTAESTAMGHAELNEHEAFDAVRQLDPGLRAELQQLMRRLADEARALAERREAWMSEAVFDIRAGRGGPWQARADQITALIGQTQPLVDHLGPLTQVDITGGEPAALYALATKLRQHLATGSTIKTTADGSPKTTGMLTPKPVKEASPLFQHVHVNGLPPVTDAQLSAFLAFVDAQRALDALDRAWPANVQIPPEDTLHERLQWHINEVAQLNRVLTLGRNLTDAEQRLMSLHVKPPTWTDLETVHTYASLVDAAAAKDAWARASQPLDSLEETVAAEARWDDAGACVHQLQLAVRSRNHDQYADSHQRLTRLHHVRELTARRDELADRLRDAAPDLERAVADTAGDEAWSERLARFQGAWSWAATGEWIMEQQTTDINALQAQIAITEARIRREVEKLASIRAWSHAVSPQRLTGQAQADLAQYASLVKRLGKGTGKYAAEQRAAIRRAMGRCRAAVPVWIMPIYRIAEQFHISENMFDVVLVDEASQAGLEATFLQYLAPKIVVIGDDKQVSPTAVGVDQQQLRDLANQYLAQDRYKDSWLDPKRSLFDEAKMRYGGHITLVEHRRCVPEIIGFSNRVAYEPEGIRLIPVRQYGADRLEPIKAIHVYDGYVRGTTNKINPAEVDAIVDHVEKCLADPRYDGLTMGVISLLGAAQARAIETKLLERVAPEEWAARELRCGDAADFQGSERDVMFLSMVSAPEPGQRLGALTQDLYVQRYNVAASRAKDQMWLFHTVALEDLGNPEDMRFALLDYCYGVIGRTQAKDERIVDRAVPDDIQVEPFDSLFEQRVFNRLYDRGYTVIPQFPAEGYNIDLVVVGSKGRLAVECDGDTWHGPAAYERDLARQRDLERCGWQFFRIRESAFYVDQTGTLAGLWQTLEELVIYPSDWMSEQMDEADGGDDQYGDFGAEWNQDDESEPVTGSPHIPQDEESHPIAPSIVDLAGHTPAVATHHPVTVPVELDEPSSPDLTWGEGRLERYTEFAGSVVSPIHASPTQLRAGLLSIVEAEGPLLGYRLHTAYVRASGGHRVGKNVAKVLNRTITSAVRSGVLTVDNPLNDSGVKPRTYRLPDQPKVRLRHLGPRILDQVPPAELAELLKRAADEHGWDNTETLFRSLLAVLGLHRLTANVEAKLTAALHLAHDGTGDIVDPQP